MDTFIARLPKVELHLHLEGSIRPETLEELAATKSWLKQRVGDWVSARERESYSYGSFEKFLAAFVLVTLLLEAPEDYALATTRLIEWLAAQQVKYAEVTLSAGVILWKKQPLDAVFEAIAQAAAEAGRRCGVRVQWIFDAVRQFGADPALAVLEWASRFRLQGVIAFGIGGDEIRGPAALFTDVYRRARGLGLHVTAHAGEAAGPESIRDAVELLGAERIGHGLTILRDPSVVELVRARAIPLEVCPTSNVATGLIADFQEHPLPKFLEAGLTVTINSDDPAMFGTSLERELELAARTFGLSSQQIVELSENAIQAAFLPDHERAGLLRELHAAAEL
ncbi:MAG TPA: adenosine deaminase [Terriglobia bacterium]|nr:adenosine deaminase [Terriglobia bacterium]